MKRITIMIAEDIDILREDLVDYLKQNELFEITGEASSGKEIVELAQLNPPDIILMDIEMETLYAGVRAAETIAQFNLPISIIYFTAHETNEMVLTAMATGAVDYIVKGSAYKDIERHIIAAANGTPLMEGVA
ncbi:MAG: response regulator transcription factor [Aerococcaceae bacterium]|nr:response regulator transcription factor [Aerococcaceae bacterium]